MKGSPQGKYLHLLDIIQPLLSKPSVQHRSIPDFNPSQDSKSIMACQPLGRVKNPCDWLSYISCQFAEIGQLLIWSNP